MNILNKNNQNNPNKDKSYKKLPPDEVQGLLEFRKRGSKISSKKGKGSFKRKPKYPDNDKES